MKSSLSLSLFIYMPAEKLHSAPLRCIWWRTKLENGLDRAHMDTTGTKAAVLVKALLTARTPCPRLLLLPQEVTMSWWLPFFVKCLFGLHLPLRSHCSRGLPEDESKPKASQMFVDKFGVKTIKLIKNVKSLVICWETAQDAPLWSDVQLDYVRNWGPDAGECLVRKKKQAWRAQDVLEEQNKPPAELLRDRRSSAMTASTASICVGD